MDSLVSWEKKVTKGLLVRKDCEDHRVNTVNVENLVNLDPVVFLVNQVQPALKDPVVNKVSKVLRDLVDPMDHRAPKVTLGHKVK